MKRFISSFILLALLAAGALAQSNPPLRITEVDGSPTKTNATRLNFPNGSLTISGGTVTVSASGSFSAPVVIASNSAACFEVGPNGSTNPVFRVVCNVASQASGLSITGNAAGSGVYLSALSSGANEGIHLLALGTGTVGIRRVDAPTTNIVLLSPASGANGISSGFGGIIGVHSTTPSISSGNTVILYNPGLNLRDTGLISWTNTSNADSGSTKDIGIVRAAAGTARVSNASTGAGNWIIGTSAGAIGTSGAGVLAFTLSTAPSTSPTDTVQLYSNDAAAGDHNLYTRNEAGEINRITGLAARNSAQFDKTSSTTFSDITGITRNVEASRVYKIKGYFQTTSNVAGGVKFSVSGTATMTAISYEGLLFSGATIAAQTRATALDTAVCAVTAVTAATCQIEGVIQVNAAGTLTIQFAQNASNGTASSVLANQAFQITPIG